MWFKNIYVNGTNLLISIIYFAVYKISPNSDVIKTVRATWRPNKNNINTKHEVFIETNASKSDIIKANHKTTALDKHGIIEDYRKSRVLSSRRNNLRRHTLTMVNVITDSNITRNHLDDRL